MSTRKVSRDAKDGQFVSEEEAKANPDTTVTETVEAKEAQDKTESSVDSAQIDADPNYNDGDRKYPKAPIGEGVDPISDGIKLPNLEPNNKAE